MLNVPVKVTITLEEFNSTCSWLSELSAYKKISRDKIINSKCELTEREKRLVEIYNQEAKAIDLLIDSLAKGYGI